MYYIQSMYNVFPSSIVCKTVSVAQKKFKCCSISFSGGNAMAISLPSIMTLALLPGLTRTGNHTAIYA